MTFEPNLTQSEINTLLSYYKNEPDNFPHAINQMLRAEDGTKNRFATSIADLDTSIAKGRCCYQVLFCALSFTSNDEAEILLGRNAVFSVGSCEGVISPGHIRRVFGYFPRPGPSVGLVLGLRFKHYTTTA